MTMRHHITTRNNSSSVITKTIRFLCGLTVLTLAACNLFIEDDEEWKADVPVHTGYGYDEPVTENGEFYDLKYQFNSNVNILSDDAMKYLNKVIVSKSGWISCLDFDLNTPKDLRPVRGEILLHGICDKIPEGMMQQVVVTAEMEGVYRVITCVVPFEDLFKEIDMEIDLGKGLYLQSSGDDSKDKQTENIYSEETNNQQVKPHGNRVSKLEDEETTFSQEFERELPIWFSTDEEQEVNDHVKFSGSATVKAKFEDKYDNYIYGKIKGTARVLKSKKGIVIPLSLQMKDSIICQANLDFKGQVKGEFSIVDKSDILPENCKVTIMLGTVPIVFKICMGVNISVETAFNQDGNVKFKLPLTVQFDRSLFELGISKEDFLGLATKNIRKWKLDRENGYFALTQSFSSGTECLIELTPGLGIYTDKLSVRAILEVPKMEFNCNLPALYTGNLNYSWDIEKQPGVDLGISFGLGMAITTPNNILSALNDVVDELANAEMTIGRIMAYILLGDADTEDSNWLFESVQELNTYITGFKEYTEEDLNLYKQDPVPIKSFTWSCPWYPTLEEEKNPFKFRKKYNVYNTKTYKFEDLLHVEYYIDKKGILPMMSTFTPCLMLADKSYNYYVLMAYKDVIEANSKRPANGWKIEFDVPLKDLPEDEDILAYPGFFEGKLVAGSIYPNGIPWSVKDKFAFDKPHETNTKVPSDSEIMWVRHQFTSARQPIPLMNQYYYYRTFRVKWKVKGRNMTKTDVQYSYTPFDMRYAEADKAHTEYHPGYTTHIADFNCHREYDNYDYIDVQPSVTLGNDKNDQNTKIGSVGLSLQIIHEGEQLVYNGDGTFSIMTTDNVIKHSDGSIETKWDD